MVSFSYAICVCNESRELYSLIAFLKKVKDIEDEINIDGVLFRIIDTAGIRATTDLIESIGVEKTFEQIKLSSIAIYLFDAHEITSAELKIIVEELKNKVHNSQLLLVANKIDKEDIEYIKKEFIDFPEMFFISAKERTNIEGLKKQLINLFDSRIVNVTETIVTNARHVEALTHTNTALIKVLEGLNDNITGDFVTDPVIKNTYGLNKLTWQHFLFLIF